MHPVLFNIGKITIYTYGFLVLCGILLSLVYGLYTRKDLEKAQVIDLFFWILLFGFLGARILYILLNWPLFLVTPRSFILSRAGFVFYGGFIGGLFGGLLYVRRQNLSFAKVADWIAPLIVLGHAVARLGCFFRGCCYGIPSLAGPGVIFPPESSAYLYGYPRVPTQIISSFILVLIFIALLVRRDHKHFDGEVFLSYIFMYSAFRFFMDFLRADTLPVVGFLTLFQWILLLVVFVDSFIWLCLFLKKCRT